MSFRGINTTVIQIRRQVFTEVARMAYANVKGEAANHLMRKIPYTIIPGEEGKLRKDIFLERAIVEERVRLAMGLPTRRMDEHNSVVSGLEDASIADKYYDPPLVNVIKFACNRCPEKLVKVSDLCQGCLAHPCMEVCPKKAITWESGRSIIDQEKCIKCGRCVDVCPYNAIVKTERPCAAACGMNAIHSDELGRAEIDYSKCVSCGQCLVNCPFGAIADKGQIYQLIQGFNRGDRIYALVAPAFINQFPGLASTGKLKAALKAIGFYDVVEVAIGADLCTVDEAHDFLEEVPEKLDFMATSCCPAWSMMAKTAFPALAKNISMTMTPMVFTARMMKQKDPTARMCFIGPYAAKKLEASRRTVRHLSNNDRQRFQSGQFCGVLAAVPGDNLITALWSGAGNQRCKHPILRHAFYRALHGLVIQDLKGVALERIQFSDGNLLYLFPLLFLPGFFGGEDVICPFQRHV